MTGRFASTLWSSHASIAFADTTTRPVFPTCLSTCPARCAAVCHV